MTTDVDAIRQWLKDDPENVSLKFSLARALIDAAWVDASDWTNQYTEATAIYESLLGLDPNDRIALVNFGAVLSDQGFHERSMDYYRRAESLDWVDANLDFNIGVALINLNDEELGIQYFTSSTSKTKHPDTIQAYFDPQAH